MDSMITVSLSESEKSTIANVAKKLGVASEWLLAQMEMESSMNPLAKNAKSGARGLIQFLTSTAKGMGYKDADQLVALFPTIESQVAGPVYAYYKRGMPYSSFEDFLAYVFLPAARIWGKRDGNWKRDFTSMSNIKPALAQKIILQNGIRNMAEYADFTRKRATKYGIKTTVVKTATAGLGLLTIGLVGFMLLKRVFLSAQ
jgi:hypothetical protein